MLYNEYCKTIFNSKMLFIVKIRELFNKNHVIFKTMYIQLIEKCITHVIIRVCRSLNT